MTATLHRVRSLANRDGLGSRTTHSFVLQHHPFPKHCNVLLLSGANTAGMNLIQNSQCSAGCPHLFLTGYQGDFPDFCFLLCPSALPEWKCETAVCAFLPSFGSHWVYFSLWITSCSNGCVCLKAPFPHYSKKTFLQQLASPEPFRLTSSHCQ